MIGWTPFSQLSSLSLLSITVRLLLTTVFAGTLGYERERHRQAAGFRTYIIVADAAALVMMTNLYIGDVFGSTDLVRMPASVITGLGFLGAGTILVTKSHEIKGPDDRRRTLGGVHHRHRHRRGLLHGRHSVLRLHSAGDERAAAGGRAHPEPAEDRHRLLRAPLEAEHRAASSASRGKRTAHSPELELYADSGYGDNLVCGTFTLWAEGRTSLDDILRELSAVEGVIYLTRI